MESEALESRIWKKSSGLFLRHMISTSQTYVREVMVGVRVRVETKEVG